MYSRDFLLSLSSFPSLPKRSVRRKAFYFKIFDLDFIRKYRKNKNNVKNNTINNNYNNSDILNSNNNPKTYFLLI